MNVAGLVEVASWSCLTLLSHRASLPGALWPRVSKCDRSVRQPCLTSLDLVVLNFAEPSRGRARYGLGFSKCDRSVRQPCLTSLNGFRAYALVMGDGLFAKKRLAQMKSLLGQKRLTLNQSNWPVCFWL